MRNAVERAYNIAELRKLAKRRLPAPMFHYIDGGADDEWTLKRNSAAFDRYEFQPRCLVDVSAIDTKTTVFGETIDWPFFCSPTSSGDAARENAAQIEMGTETCSTSSTPKLAHAEGGDTGPAAW